MFFRATTVAAAVLTILHLSHAAAWAARTPEKSSSQTAAISGGSSTADGAGAGGLPDIGQKTRGLEKRSGFITTYLDRKKGQVWLELERQADGGYGSVLYVEALQSGLGSNPVGLDRGQLGDTRVIEFRRLGGRLLVEQPNLRFRAGTPSPDEARAVRESFATSVLWAGEIAAEDTSGRVLVDLTPFLLRDAHGTVAAMDTAGQGTFTLDEKRSALDPDACLAFPDNLEFESALTFQSAKPGRLVRQVAPTGQAVTLRAHHSFIRLPDAGYRPRRFDPRSGSFSILFGDYAVPLDAAIDQRLLVRHRLEKLEPGAARSRVRKPIVYYVDRGAPEPIRSALLDGARWWAAAFEAAGFEDAYRVEILPEGAHPLDVRYNVIQWVHRSTRGWSYGSGIIDPRTGEMIKGHVSLGSLRVRQDRLIFEGLGGVAKTGSGSPDDPIQLSLARIRQLSAHEVGHTLGLAHNFAASTYGRASVMDYPAPWVTLGAGEELDFSAAYGVGVGAWDVQAVRYAYEEFPVADEEARGLGAILAENQAKGYVFLTDADARSPATSDPRAALWDNTADAVEGLRMSLAVRRRALDRFGPGNLAAGQPTALLHEVFVPLYLHHRYQVQAAAKKIGGVRYEYSVQGDGRPPAMPVAVAEQKEALTVLLSAIQPAALAVRTETAALLLPRPHEYDAHGELFAGSTEPLFDPLAAAAVATRLVVEEILQPERLSRLTVQSGGGEWSPEALIETVVSDVFPASGEPGSLGEVRRVTQGVVVERLLDLAASPATAPWVRSRVAAALDKLETRLQTADSAATTERAHRRFLARAIERQRERGWDGERGDGTAPTVDMPPGQPIGMAGSATTDEGCGWAWAER